MSKYVINSNNHFFEVKDEVPVDLDELKRRGCEVVANREQMYESVMATTGLELDEIEGGEFVVTYRESLNGVPNCLICVEARGPVERIEETNEYARGGIEEYLADYVL